MSSETVTVPAYEGLLTKTQMTNDNYWKHGVLQSWCHTSLIDWMRGSSSSHYKTSTRYMKTGEE
jgi:hypothetical protein